MNLRRCFDHPDYQADAFLHVLSLSQGMSSVADYTVEFWTLAAEVDGPTMPLELFLSKVLSKKLKDELVSRDYPPNLESLVFQKGTLISKSGGTDGPK